MTIGSNLWRRYQGKRFPVQGLALYAPLWHPELSGSPFISKDLNATSCTVTGAVWGITGRTFVSTSSQYIDCTNGASLDIQGVITIEAWVNVSAFGDKVIVSNYDAGAANCQYQLKLGAGKNLLYDIATGGQEEMISTGTIDTGWYYVAAVNDLSNVHFYINGVLDSSPATAKTPPATRGNTSIGRGGSYNGLYLDGIVGEVRIYTRILTASEIARNYQATKWRY